MAGGASDGGLCVDQAWLRTSRGRAVGCTGGGGPRRPAPTSRPAGESPLAFPFLPDVSGFTPSIGQGRVLLVGSYLFGATAKSATMDGTHGAGSRPMDTSVVQGAGYLAVRVRGLLRSRTASEVRDALLKA